MHADRSIAGGLGYEVVDFTDTDSGKNYHLLKEATANDEVTKGWGSYFYNANATKHVLIQAPPCSLFAELLH
ncbi:hypothetical protein [Haloferula sp.]|uniref:hypothetical protein n=1 Tax=Haloferula sp. TaxID=2497595 RepID=UPI0032A06147